MTRTDFFWRRQGLFWFVFRAELADDGSIVKEKAMTPPLWTESTAATICNNMFDCYQYGRDKQSAQARLSR